MSTELIAIPEEFLQDTSASEAQTIAFPHYKRTKSHNRQRILGIDPGIERVGFGLLTIQLDYPAKNAVTQRVTGRAPAWAMAAEQWGVIYTSKNKTTANRLLEIYQDLSSLVDQLKPDVIAIEKIFFARNAKTLIPVCQARGVILLVCAERNIAMAEYTPMEIKKTICGNGHAQKKEVQQMIHQRLAMAEIPKPDDAADALAIALCYHLHEPIV